ncbi:hypothetical protein L7F22_059402 [Adiantum nelumboides]|nr:hypothetical protein [Adiantum nelumboides]
MRKRLWSPEEDEVLRRFVERHGCGRWSQVVRLTGRSDNDVKNAWHLCNRRRQRGPSNDIDCDSSLSLLSMGCKNYNDQMSTLVTSCSSIRTQLLPQNESLALPSSVDQPPEGLHQSPFEERCRSQGIGHRWIRGGRVLRSLRGRGAGRLKLGAAAERFFLILCREGAAGLRPLREERTCWIRGASTTSPFVGSLIFEEGGVGPSLLWEEQ